MPAPPHRSSSAAVVPRPEEQRSRSRLPTAAAAAAAAAAALALRFFGFGLCRRSGLANDQVLVDVLDRPHLAGTGGLRRGRRGRGRRGLVTVRRGGWWW